MAAKQQDEFARRRAQRQKRIRKRRLTVALIFFLIIAAVTGIVLSLTVLFPVTAVKGTGSKIYTAEQIKKASGLSGDDNIFTFSKTAVAERIQKQLPFIETVEIERRLPDTVEITVQDAKEFACYPVKGEYYTVSRSGKVLNVYEKIPEELFTVRVNDVTCVIGDQIAFSNEREEETVNILMESMLDHGIIINEIDITDQLSLKAKINNRFIVDFGTSGSLEKKIGHLGGMVRSIAEDRTGYINLSMWTVEKTEGTFTEKPIE